jgi:threonine dehydrogenase-like Zn-dependent dehydrogenase
LIYKTTAGCGVHAVFDTVGTQTTVDSALLCLRTGGTLVNLAVWKKNVTMNMNFLFKEIVVTGEFNQCWIRFLRCRRGLTYDDLGRIGAMAYDNHAYPEVIQAVASGKIQGIEELITDRIQIEDIVTKGYLTLLSQDEHSECPSTQVVL